MNFDPVSGSYLRNIKASCGVSVTSASLMRKSLNDTVLLFMAIGLAYGLLTLENENNQDVLYFTGHWTFRT